MKTQHTDLLIVGAGPVGLMCAYLAKLCGFAVTIIDKRASPTLVGRADALNARSLQFLTMLNLFNDLYPKGKPCNTSSVWKNGNFISRQSSWWDNLTGCMHKHFLMLGQAHLEHLLNQKILSMQSAVQRNIELIDIRNVNGNDVFCLSNQQHITADYVIAADGPHSLVRDKLRIQFNVIRPNIHWAVIDGVIDSNFPKVPEIIAFQTETADVAWIPREGDLDRFYVKMPQAQFSFQEALQKINVAMRPHQLDFKEIVWFSQFSVQESVAEKFMHKPHIFLAGDAAHIHSVNGGQGLNTGIADAMNLIWKLHLHAHHEANDNILSSYEIERRPVALDVIQTSGALVRSTDCADSDNHAENYVALIEKYASFITGMGIGYGSNDKEGKRLYDFWIYEQSKKLPLYRLLNYQRYTLLIFSAQRFDIPATAYLQVITIKPQVTRAGYWTKEKHYQNQAILVRPDSYIKKVITLDKLQETCLLTLCLNDFGNTT